MAPRVLLLDPPTRISRDLEEALCASGMEVVRHEEPAQALAALRESGFDVALGERSLSSDTLLAAALALPGAPPVILLDDFGSMEQARRSLEAGVFEVLARPLPHGAVLQSVERALERRSLLHENDSLRTEVDGHSALDGLQTADARMRHVFAILASVADSDATVLLSGESGVGKTVLARAIHRRSARADGPFVEVNCGALPETLLESELFGHRKGAFTGAVRDRIGKFEAAHGGTLFLDEIATASPALQVKLLRVLEDKTFEAVGDERTRSADVRLLAATNQDLLAEVQAGRFREDLFYRINVVAVEVPPLRERKGDIPLFARTFVERFAQRHRRPIQDISPAALTQLTEAAWPGNVRELENTLERAVLLAPGPVLNLEDLGLAPARTAPASEAADRIEDLPLGPLKEALEIPERALILRALDLHAGNRQGTARTLGINRTTLFNKMRKYGLLSPSTDEPDEGAEDRA